MRIVIATPPERLIDGKFCMLFPSRCDWVGEAPSGTKYYPYELGYLSSLLKRDLPGADVKLIDGNLAGMGYFALTAAIAEREPDVLITEAGHLTYPTMTHILQTLRKITPGMRFILTGPYATAFPAQCAADGWEPVSGEYEYKVLAKLRGEAEPQGYIDLDSLPFPEDDDVSRLSYHEEACIEDGTVQGYATRGCPLSCSYCVVPLYYGGHGRSHKSHRTRAVGSVCAEVEELAYRHKGFRGVFWNDEAHNANPAWLAQLSQALINRGLNIYHYDAMCGYWGWNEALVKQISQAGYKQIRLGVETLNGGVGKRIGKVVFPAKLVQVLEWLKEYGISVHLTAMVGLPGSTFQTDLQTLEALLGMKADGLWATCQHSPATPNPGTAFYNQAKQNGWLATEDFSQFHWRNVVLNYPDYSRNEIEKARKAYYWLRADVRRDDDDSLLLVS